MSKLHGQPNDEMVISLVDLWHLCQRNRRKIATGAMVLAIAAALFALTRPITYDFIATFRERENKEAGVAGIADYMRLTSSKAQDSRAASLMQSRVLMEALVETLQLQSALTPKGTSEGFLSRIFKNLKIEYAYLCRKAAPLFPDLSINVKCTDVRYWGEIAVGLSVQFLSDERYVVFEGGRKKLGEGILGTPFSHEDFSFNLTKGPSSEPLATKEFSLTLYPLPIIAEALSKTVKIESDADDKNLLEITFTHPDRHLGVDIVNGLMMEYQEYLRKENRNKAKIQLTYLEKRQQETGEALTSIMENHAKECSEDIANTGFFNAEKRMEFLSQSLQEYRKRLLAINLERKRLQHLKDEGDVVFYDRYSSSGDSEILNPIFAQFRALKQQRVALDLALSSEPPRSPKDIEALFAQQMAQVAILQGKLSELNTILFALENDQPLPKLAVNGGDQSLMIKLWYDTIAKAEQAVQQASQGQKGSKVYALEGQKENFANYLKQLIKMFSLREGLIQERLAYQRHTFDEFQGIDLEAATQLYISYQKQLDDTQARTKQNNFIVEHLANPQFEVNSLSEVLKDKISLDAIARAGQILLSLQDGANRTEKEQSRLKEDLALQKQFLSSHIQQMTEMEKLREQLLQAKIRSLQGVSVDLIQQKISILEKQLQDYLSTRIANIDQEQEVINQHLHELHNEMAQLPSKWVAEKMVDRQLSANQRMVEDVTRMVESKIMSHNLELIQSAPIDIAVAPLLPNSPRTVRFTLLGACLGVFLTTMLVLFRALLTGLPATRENLHIIGQKVAGTLSAQCQHTSILSDNDLDTLRHLVKELPTKAIPTSGGRLLLTIQGSGLDYAKPLATVLSKAGMRVLILPVSFDVPANPAQGPGLLQYLEGSEETPKIIKENDYDIIAAGGISRYASEYVTSERFRSLLARYLAHYDWIIAVSHAPALSAEAYVQASWAQHMAVTLSSERMDSLKNYFELSQTKDVIFLFREISR